MKTNCISCEKQVENWDIAYPEGESPVHPIGGTVFRTYGHYGSSVFDPMDETYLEVVVCDTCLKNQLKYAYKGVDQKRAKELAQNRKEQDALFDFIFLEREKDGQE